MFRQSHLTVFRFAFVCVALCAATSVSLAQRDLRDIPPPDPALEQQTFQLPDGFEVNLFAADPVIAKPIQMNFDEAGRLWVVSSEVYPHIEPGAEARDRVLVIEDVDSDGTADKTSVFATGLLIPTGIAPGDGGAWVANSTQLLHYRDTDGDLKADSKRIVLSGFGTEDTHHILHTLRWGPDGYLYFNQSIYIHSHIETPWGVRRLNAGGIWQFRPETLELGVFMRGLVNSWGHHFDRFGQSFATDGAGGEGINYVVPGAYYFTAYNAPQILHGLNPGSPKHCGLELVETPMLPPDWQGCAITNDFRGHRVCRFRLTEDRSGFVSREQQEVIRSDHVAFRPIDVKLGPDGAIYIADWYNPIIQHGEVDFRDPRRDHTHGRIWRVTWKGAPSRKPLDLTALSIRELLDQLSSPDNYYRQSAKQLLRQRGQDVLPVLDSWLADIPSNAETEHLRLEALWSYQSLRKINRPLLEQLLQANDGRVRAAAVRVLSHWQFELGADALTLLQRAAADAHPRVRLEAARAAAFSPNADSELRTAVAAHKDSADAIRAAATSPRRVEIALQVAERPTDTFLDYAVWLSARELAPAWLDAFRRGEVTFGGSVSQLLTAFSAVGEGAPVDFLLTRVYAAETSPEQRRQAVSIIAGSGNAAQIAALVAAAAEQADAEAIRVAMNEARRRKLKVALNENTIQRLETSESRDVRSAGFAVMGLWRTPDALKHLTDILHDSERPLSDRMGAAEGLVLFADSRAIQSLTAMISDVHQPPLLRKHGVALLSGVRVHQAAQLAGKLLPQLKAEDHPEDLIRSFLAVRAGADALASALADVRLSADVAREMLRVVRESGQALPVLEDAIRKAGRVTGRKTMSPEERAAVLQMAKEKATAAEGERVFRMARLNCLKCHAIGGAGGKVGPDMVSLGGSAQPDYLLESLLDPNAKIKENYHTVVIVTTEGRLLSGIQVQQSEKAVVIRDAEDRLITVPREEIEEMTQGLSLMPEGLVDTLTDLELAALVRFLSELGRTPEFTVSRRKLARTWSVMRATPEAAFRLRRTSYAMAASDDPAFQWVPAYSTVAGSLPLSDIPTVFVKNRVAAGSRGVGFVRCVLVAETAGTVRIRLNSAQGLELRMNDIPLDPVENLEVDVRPGRYRLTLTVDKTQRSQPLEMEILDEGTTAVAAFQN